MSVRLAAVAFRQQAGPSASASQIRRLQELLEEAGYASVRSARGPLGLTQRQGLGKFTNTEVEELIDRLERDAELADHAGVAPPATSDVTQRPLQDTPTEMLIVELQERGWKCSQQ
jgi:hypothetical protein